MLSASGGSCHVAETYMSCLKAYMCICQWGGQTGLLEGIYVFCKDINVYANGGPRLGLVDMYVVHDDIYVLSAPSGKNSSGLTYMCFSRTYMWIYGVAFRKDEFRSAGVPEHEGGEAGLRSGKTSSGPPDRIPDLRTAFRSCAPEDPALRAGSGIFGGRSGMSRFSTSSSSRFPSTVPFHFFNLLV